MKRPKARYAKAGPQGGQLIRKVLAFLKSQKIPLPLQSHILIAVSGGSDSVGLAHLVVHLGRKIVPKDQITLLHVNHQWRGKESDADETFVHSLGERWGVPVISRRVDPNWDGNAGPGASGSSGSGPVATELAAREARKKIFAEEAAKLNAIILTAHQGDDVAETLLWRLFTGAAKTHGAGIRVRQGFELRPLLTIRKSEIQLYLDEVGESHREDLTNQDRRYLRAKMREKLMPEISRIFPKAIEHLIQAALDAGSHSGDLDSSASLPSILLPLLFRVANVNVRRPHLEFMLDGWIAEKEQKGKREIHLEGGWKLIHEKSPVAPMEKWELTQWTKKLW